MAVCTSFVFVWHLLMLIRLSIQTEEKIPENTQASVPRALSFHRRFWGPGVAPFLSLSSLSQCIAGASKEGYPDGNFETWLCHREDV